MIARWRSFICLPRREPVSLATSRLPEPPQIGRSFSWHRAAPLSASVTCGVEPVTRRQNALTPMGRDPGLEMGTVGSRRYVCQARTVTSSDRSAPDSTRGQFRIV